MNSALARANEHVRGGGERLVASVLSLVVLFQIALLLFLIRRDPLSLNRIGSVLHPPKVPQHVVLDAGEFCKDPWPGYVIPDSGVGHTLRLSGRKAAACFLVVPIGDCAGCLAIDIKAWNSDAVKRGIPMILVTSADKDKAQEFRTRLKLTMPIVSDISGSVISHLNVAWPGRAYVFSKDWQLVGLQHAQDPNYNPFNDREFSAILGGAQ